MASLKDGPDAERLKALEGRIEALRRDKTEAVAPAALADKYSKAGLAWRMVIELVAGMAIGVGIGYGLDSLFGTLPIFLMIFTLLGLAAGIRVMMQTAQEFQRQQAEKG
jgi:ATP synthase protein I